MLRPRWPQRALAAALASLLLQAANADYQQWPAAPPSYVYAGNTQSAAQTALDVAIATMQARCTCARILYFMCHNLFSQLFTLFSTNADAKLLGAHHSASRGNPADGRLLPGRGADC